MPDGERGQSEVVGFLLIFSIVVLAIALLGITAFAGLDTAQEFQETTSTEQAFIVLADNIDDLAREGAPSRGTEISVSEASLSLAEAEQINITIGGEETKTIETQPIVYESRSDTSISYSSGMLIREDGANGLLFREPKFVLTEETVILPVVSTTAVEDTTIAGTTAVQVETRSNGTEVIAAEEFAEETTVTIEVSSPRADLWEEHLSASEATDCNSANGTVVCSIDTAQAFVSVEKVEVTLR